MALKWEQLDSPIMFSFTIALLVVFWISVMGWFFASMHWTGPLSLVKGGVAP